MATAKSNTELLKTEIPKTDLSRKGLSKKGLSKHGHGDGSPVVSSTFELHTEFAPPEIALGVDDLPWHNGHLTGASFASPPLCIDENCGSVWCARDANNGWLETVAGSKDAAFGLRVASTQKKLYLALIARTPGILVNGIPALELTALTVRDTLVLAPGSLTYVTERRHPYRGKPRPEWIDTPCQYCRIKIGADTTVVTCPHCNSIYHDEDPSSDDGERLDCYRHVKNCLNVACRREMAVEAQLVWDPRSLSKGSDGI